MILSSLTILKIKFLLPFYYPKITIPLLWDDKNDKIVARVKIMIYELDPKLRFIEIKKKSPASLPAVNVMDSATHKIDAVRIAYETGVITNSQLMRNVLESQGVRYLEPGERPKLPEITDERLEDLFAEAVIPAFKEGLRGISEFYNSQPMFDRYSFEQGDNDLERRKWLNFIMRIYGEKNVKDEYDFKNQLSSNLMGRLQLYVDFAGKYNKDKERHKELIEAFVYMKNDLASAIADYNKLPLEEKLAIVLFFEEQAKLFFDLLAGTVDPSEILKKRQEAENKKPDEDPDGQLVGMEK